MLKLNHCLEERCQLGIEVDNLCCWFGWELFALETAVLSPSGESFLYGVRFQNLTVFRPNNPDASQEPLRSSDVTEVSLE